MYIWYKLEGTELVFFSINNSGMPEPFGIKHGKHSIL